MSVNKDSKRRNFREEYKANREIQRRIRVRVLGILAGQNLVDCIILRKKYKFSNVYENRCENLVIRAAKLRLENNYYF